MLIYFNGDSNTSGMELDDPTTQSFAAHLCSKLGAESINQAISGASNEMIFRNTLNYLDTCQRSGHYPDLMIIGWTESCREDWFVDGSYVSIDTLGINRPADRESRYQDYHSRTRDMDYRHHLWKFYNAKIFDFHQQLQHLGIPHLFFHAIESFNHWEIDRSPVHQFDWGASFFHPYESDLTMRKYAMDRNYEEISPGWHHYKEDFQILWADMLVDHLSHNQLR